jgi:hypothetical protein
MSNNKVVLSNTSIEIKTEEVVKKQTIADGTILQEAIAHTLESGGYYHYASEPRLDFTDYDDKVEVELEKEGILVDDMIDAHFVVELIKRIDKIKENNNE